MSDSESEDLSDNEVEQLYSKFEKEFDKVMKLYKEGRTNELNLNNRVGGLLVEYKVLFEYSYGIQLLVHKLINPNGIESKKTIEQIRLLRGNIEFLLIHKKVRDFIRDNTDTSVDEIRKIINTRVEEKKEEKKEEKESKTESKMENKSQEQNMYSDERNRIKRMVDDFAAEFEKKLKEYKGKPELDKKLNTLITAYSQDLNTPYGIDFLYDFLYNLDLTGIDYKELRHAKSAIERLINLDMFKRYHEDMRKKVIKSLKNEGSDTKESKEQKGQNLTKLTKQEISKLYDKFIDKFSRLMQKYRNNDIDKVKLNDDLIDLIKKYRSMFNHDYYGDKLISEGIIFSDMERLPVLKKTVEYLLEIDNIRKYIGQETSGGIEKIERYTGIENKDTEKMVEKTAKQILNGDYKKAIKTLEEIGNIDGDGILKLLELLVKDDSKEAGSLADLILSKGYTPPDDKIHRLITELIKHSNYHVLNPIIIFTDEIPERDDIKLLLENFDKPTIKRINKTTRNGLLSEIGGFIMKLIEDDADYKDIRRYLDKSPGSDIFTDTMIPTKKTMKFLTSYYENPVDILVANFKSRDTKLLDYLRELGVKPETISRAVEDGVKLGNVIAPEIIEYVKRLKPKYDAKKCFNKTNLITLEDLEDWQESVIFIHPEKKGNDNAECYLTNEFRESFKRYESKEDRLTQWEYDRDEKGNFVKDSRGDKISHSKGESYPVFKLPSSGIWIQSTKYLLTRYNTFVLKEIGVHPIGSSFGVSRLHGAEEKLYRPIPVNRAKFYKSGSFEMPEENWIFKPEPDDEISDHPIKYIKGTIVKIMPDGGFIESSTKSTMLYSATKILHAKIDKEAEDNMNDWFKGGEEDIDSGGGEESEGIEEYSFDEDDYSS